MLGAGPIARRQRKLGTVFSSHRRSIPRPHDYGARFDPSSSGRSPRGLHQRGVAATPPSPTHRRRPDPMRRLPAPSCHAGPPFSRSRTLTPRWRRDARAHTAPARRLARMLLRRSTSWRAPRSKHPGAANSGAGAHVENRRESACAASGIARHRWSGAAAMLPRGVRTGYVGPQDHAPTPVETKNLRAHVNTSRGQRSARFCCGCRTRRVP